MGACRWGRGTLALVACLLFASAGAGGAAEGPFRLSFYLSEEPDPALPGTPYHAVARCFLWPDVDLTPQQGATAWSVGFCVEGVPFRDPTVSGTKAAPSDQPPGLRQGGFERTEIITGGIGDCADCEGVISVVALSDDGSVTLPVDQASTILKFELDGEHPARGEEIPVRLVYLDGCQGSGEPVTNLVENQEGAHVPELSPREFILPGIPPCPDEEHRVQAFFQDGNVGQSAQFADGLIPTPDPLYPGEIEASPGSTDVFVGIGSNIVGEPPGVGEPPQAVQGWSFSIGLSGNVHLADAFTEGTVAGKVEDGPPGIRTESSFEVTDVVDPSLPYLGTLEPQGQGVVSAIVLNFTGPWVTLDPVGTATVLGMTIEGEEGDEGLLQFRYGLRGGGGPVNNLATVASATEEFGCKQEATIRFVIGEAPFHRGDVNDDGKLDIGDPIVLLDNLFLGAPRGPCRDAADFNDDGAVDISDAIGALQFLFLGGDPPPFPGPPGEPCGMDPLPHAPGECRIYVSC